MGSLKVMCFLKQIVSVALTCNSDCSVNNIIPVQSYLNLPGKIIGVNLTL